MLEIIDKDIKTVAITVFHTLARAKIEHVKYLETHLAHTKHLIRVSNSCYYFIIFHSSFLVSIRYILFSIPTQHIAQDQKYTEYGERTLKLISNGICIEIKL